MSNTSDISEPFNAMSGFVDSLRQHESNCNLCGQMVLISAFKMFIAMICRVNAASEAKFLEKYFSTVKSLSIKSI